MSARSRSGGTRRVLAIGVLVLPDVGAFAFMLLRGRPSPAPTGMSAAQEKEMDPLRRETSCVDRLQRNDLDAEQIDSSLAGCRGEGPENRSAGR